MRFSLSSSHTLLEMKCDMQISYEMVSNVHVHQLTVSLKGPLYTTPGCFLPRVESPQRVTLSQSNVYKRSHENGSQAGSAPLAG